MNDERNEGSPFFRLPQAGNWNDVDPGLRADVRALCATLQAAEDGGDAPTPLEVAMKMSELANRLFEHLTGEERDIRQVISTLRTAHAVAWDFYDAVQATRVSVDEYMRALRRNIDSFENDLHELQKSRKAA